MLYISQDHDLCYSGVGKSDTLFKRRITKESSSSEDLCYMDGNKTRIKFVRETRICLRNNYTVGISLPTTEKRVSVVILQNLCGSVCSQEPYR